MDNLSPWKRWRRARLSVSFSNAYWFYFCYCHSVFCECCCYYPPSHNGHLFEIDRLAKLSKLKIVTMSITVIICKWNNYCDLWFEFKISYQLSIWKFKWTDFFCIGKDPIPKTLGQSHYFRCVRRQQHGAPVWDPWHHWCA